MTALPGHAQANRDDRPGIERDRLVALSGTFNLRDVGGYPARNGVTRWGKLYRSDALHALEQSDRDELDRRGIGVVIDLRGADEQELFPDRLDGLQIELRRHPVSSKPMSAFISEDAGLDRMYDYLLDHDSDELISAVRTIARSGSVPVLVHCTAGKDRTGLVIALALLLAGVDRAAVLRDYAATESHLPAALLDEIIGRLRAEQVPDAVHLDELVRLSPASVLDRALTRIESRYGSLESFSREHGLGSSDLDSLVQALLDESPKADL